LTSILRINLRKIQPGLPKDVVSHHSQDLSKNSTGHKMGETFGKIFFENKKMLDKLKKGVIIFSSLVY
jgi:hypothetical protein